MRQTIKEFDKESILHQFPDDDYLFCVPGSFYFTILKMSIFMLPQPLASVPESWIMSNAVTDSNMFFIHCALAEISWNSVNLDGEEVTLCHEAGMLLAHTSCLLVFTCDILCRHGSSCRLF